MTTDYMFHLIARVPVIFVPNSTSYWYGVAFFCEAVDLLCSVTRGTL